MQFSIATIFTLLAAVAVAQPIAETTNNRVPYARSIINRQEKVPINAPAMTDANGNVVAYNVAGVTHPMKDQGF